jgi:hypothetical protein
MRRAATFKFVNYFNTLDLHLGGATRFIERDFEGTNLKTHIQGAASLDDAPPPNSTN